MLEIRTCKEIDFGHVSMASHVRILTLSITVLKLERYKLLYRIGKS